MLITSESHKFPEYYTKFDYRSRFDDVDSVVVKCKDQKSIYRISGDLNFLSWLFWDVAQNILTSIEPTSMPVPEPKYHYMPMPQYFVEKDELREKLYKQEKLLREFCKRFNIVGLLPTANQPNFYTNIQPEDVAAKIIFHVRSMLWIRDVCCPPGTQSLP